MGKWASGVYKSHYVDRLEDRELAERCLIVGDYCIRFGGPVVTVEADGEQVQAIPATPSRSQAVQQALTWVQAAYNEQGAAERALNLIPAAKRRYMRMTGWMG